jgi:hypothetical protein
MLQKQVGSSYTIYASNKAKFSYTKSWKKKKKEIERDLAIDLVILSF